MKICVELPMTPLQLAEEFCEWDDERQAQFFIEVTAIMGRWGSTERSWQAFTIGGHLRTCACSTDATRELIKEISDNANRECGTSPARTSEDT